MPNQPLICPQCRAYGRRQILGSLRDDGQLIILRHSHGTTLVNAQEMTLSCGCGYRFYINGGTIEAPKNPVNTP